MRTLLTCIFIILSSGYMHMDAQPKVFTPVGTGGGGYMYTPSINPNHPNEMWINCDMGGVYRTEDGGRLWTLMPYDQNVSTVKGKLQFTNDPNVIYVVNRSQDSNLTPWYQGRAMKSTDGGNSWTDIDPTGSGTHRLFADPNDASRIILNEYNALYISNDGGLSFQRMETPDWDLVWLAGVYWNGNDIWIATDNGLLYSENGGASFDILNVDGLQDNEGIYQMSGAKQNGEVSLFIVTADIELLKPWHEVLEIQDGLKEFYSYKPATSTLTNIRNNIPNDAKIAWMESASNNSEIIWASGDIADLPVIYKSTDSGSTWEQTFKIEGNANTSTGWAGEYGIVSMYWSGGILGMDVDDQDPNHVLTTSGFAFQTTNGGLTWEQCYVDRSFANAPGQPSEQKKPYKSSGLDVTTSHHLHWIGKDTILASCTDIGNQYSVDGGESWSFDKNMRTPWDNLTWPNWYRVLSHPKSGRLYAALSEINDIYLGYRLSDEAVNGQGIIVFSDDQGKSWDTLYNFGHPVVWVEMSPLNPDIMYASVVHHTQGGIFRTQDGGSTWTQLSVSPRAEGHAYTIKCLKDGSVVATFSARAPEDTNNLSSSSGVFWSPNGIDQWSDVSAPEMIYYTKDITLDPHDANQNTWYVTVWGRFNVFPGGNSEGYGGVYRTKNRGLTWERILEEDLAESMSIHPDISDVAYLAIENGGLYFTENLNSDRPTFITVNSFPFWRPKRIFWDPHSQIGNRKLWVTTMGGGMWYGLEAFSSRTEDDTFPNEVHISPNPVTNLLQMKVSNPTVELEWEILDIMGNCIKKGMIFQNTALDTEDLASGLYFIHIHGKGIYKFVKIE